MKKEQVVELNRSLGLWSALALVIGTIIGSGVFVRQAAVLDQTGSVKVALFAWLAGGIMTLAAGLTIAEVASQMPKTGGLYYYMEKMYGRIWGFLSGWMQIIVYGPAMIATIAAYLGILIVDFFGINPAFKIPIAVISITLLAILNFFSNRYGAMFAIVTTVCKLVPVLAIIILGLFFGKEQSLVQSINGIQTSTGSFGVAILGTLFAYDGWILVANLGDEIKNPARRLPQAIIWGIVIVTFAYVFVSFGVFQSIGAAKVHQLGIGAIPYLASKSFGVYGGRLLSIGVIISIVGCLNGKVMTFPRIMYAMADNRELPFSKQLSYLHPKSRTPIWSVVTIVGIAIIMIVFFDADRLSELCIFTVYCFYLMAFFGSFKLRRQNLDRVFSVPLYPLPQLVAIGSSIFVLVSEIQNDLIGVMLSLMIVLVGVPVYWKYRNQRSIVDNKVVQER